MPSGRRFQLNFLVLSVSYILIGVLMLLLNTDTSRLLISYLLAAIVLVLGLVRFSFFFIKDEISRVFKNDLAIGAVMLLAGIYIISHADDIWQWVPVVLGFVVVFDSIIKMQNAFELKRLAFRFWWPLLVAGLITLILGALLIIEVFSEDVLYIYLAVVMLIDGVLNLVALGLVTWQLHSASKADGEKTSFFGHFKKEKTDSSPPAPAQAAPMASPPASAAPPAPAAPPSPQGSAPPHIADD